MPTSSALLIVASFLVVAADDPVQIRVPITRAGEVDLNQIIGTLAERVGVVVPRPSGSLKLPIQALPGALTRKMLSDTLGPEVTVEVLESEVRFRFDPPGEAAGRLARLQARLNELAGLSRREALRRAQYGFRARASYRPNDADRPTVCLIHGINSTSGVFVHMIPPLETAELGVVVYDFPFNRDLEETAAAFERDWVRFRTQQGDTRPWSIVAHSMGALLARSYVEGDTYQKDVDHLILLGPVNQGSWLAQAQGLLQLVEGLQAVNQRTSTTLAHLGDGLGAAADDLLPGSRFLTELNRRSRREGVRYHILAGSAGFLTAETRARLDAQFRAVARPSSLLNGIARLTLRDLGPRLDELTEGTGDGCVSVASTRLAGVEDHVVIPANHVELIRGPLLYPEPGPVVSLPFILQWLGIETPR